MVFEVKGIVYTCVFVLMALSLLSCYDDYPYDYGVPFDSRYRPGHPGSRLADFPNTVGTNWVYAIYDSVRQQADTVDITIIGSRFDPFGTTITTLWFQSSAYSGLGSVGYYKDTVRLYGGWGFGRTFVFPLVVGKSWGFDFRRGWDSVRVVSLDSITVPAGQFSKCLFLLGRSYQVGPVATYYTKTWFVPKIGIIKMYTYGGSAGPRETSVVWSLLRYHIVR